MPNVSNKIVNGTTNDVIDDTPKVTPPWRRKIPEPVESQLKNNNTNLSVNEINTQSSIKQSPVTSVTSMKVTEKKLEKDENEEPEEKPRGRFV
ncbi:unnamed protein product [Onchocerca ochengi]|uniref:Uncharacterized protein n=1 Tax=Onchocerca ochengi TaxID=42157 RepID=A0A182EX39_ONCOC|nr:unnamed protein product [Onchocerca ochengi]